MAFSAIGGWFYWQQYKKGIIKNAIENAVNKGTDSLYFIHYDSSSIDEVNGNASFYNVTLQSDSLQKQLLLFDTTSSATVYNIHIDEVTILGANIPGIINNTSVEARSILIKHPVVFIIRSGKNKKKLINGSDSLLIYEKLLGRFNSINASEIKIKDGNLFFADKTGKPHTALKNISVTLKNFRIDSTKNYQNIISYFVKDVVAKVAEVYIKGDNNQAVFTDIEYDAPEKLLRIKKFQQKNKDQQLVFDVNSTSIYNISTDSFILKQQIRAEELISDGGMLSFYRKPAKDSAKNEIEIDNNYFDEAVLNKVNIGTTKILIYNNAKPEEPPLIISNVKFKAWDIQKLHSGTNIKNLVSSSNWTLSADGFSFMTANKRYKMIVGAFDINNANSSMHIKNFTVKPQFTEVAFSKSLTYQEDLYNMEFKNIALAGVNIKSLITQNKLVVEKATLQPELGIYVDRTVTANPTSKVGKYPHQLLQKLKFPVCINTMIIKNGHVAYKERNPESGQIGTVFFKNINGTINNISNIKEQISKNSMLVLNARASFMGVCDLQTTWKLPLNTTNGSFHVSGVGARFNATALNTITEPLGLVSITDGRINKVTFDISGTDLMTRGTSTLLYDNLKIEVLKQDSADTKKKILKSFIANLMMKDANPQNGVTRINDAGLQRDMTKSFFFLVWKSIFAAAKKTVNGKNAE